MWTHKTCFEQAKQMTSLAVKEHHKRSIWRVPMIIWQVWTGVFSTNLPKPRD